MIWQHTACTHRVLLSTLNERILKSCGHLAAAWDVTGSPESLMGITDPKTRQTCLENALQGPKAQEELPCPVEREQL